MRARAPVRAVPFLAVIAVAVTLTTLALTFAVAGDTLGYDFRAYHAAAARVLEGQPLYDLDFDIAGPAGLFLYPPPFILIALPFGLLEFAPAGWIWIAASLAAFGAGVALLPVSPTVRWLTLLLAGLSWPFVYAIKLGQVGPLLFLLFAVAWRWIERPGVLGASAALGTVVKLQPAILFLAALVQRRWAVIGWGVATLAVVTILSLPITGLSAWTDYVTLLRRVSDPIATPHNFTPGAVAYQLGAAHEAASLIQLTSTVAALVAVVYAAWRRSPVVALLVSVVASQLLSPVLWDHYAMLLLLPVAWLLERRAWWAALVPLAMAVFLVGLTPAVAYPVAFWVVLGAILIASSSRSSSGVSAAPT